MKINDKALKEAQSAHDAVAAYKVIYETLGLDEKFIKALHTSRKKK
jgi:hypothetical protein